MTDSHRQREALKDETRFAIYTFIREQDRPVTTGTVALEVEGALDYAKAFRHIAILVDVELVKKVDCWPNRYTAVEL